MIGENSKSLHRSRLVQRFVLVRAKYLREIFGQKSAESEIRIGDSQRAVLLVTSWARMRPCALGPDLEQTRPEEKHRSTPCRNCVHVQLQPNFCRNVSINLPLVLYSLINYYPTIYRARYQILTKLKLLLYRFHISCWKFTRVQSSRGIPAQLGS